MYYLSSSSKVRDIYQLNYGTKCSLSDARVAHFKHPKRKTAAFFGQKGWWKSSSLIHFLAPTFQSLNLISAFSSYLTSCWNTYLCFHVNSGLQKKTDFQLCLMTWHPALYLVAGNLTFWVACPNNSMSVILGN